MRKYFLLMSRFLEASVSSMLVYPGEFFSSMSIAVYWVVLALVSVSILTYQADNVAGWNRYHLFLVQGIYSVLIGLVYGFFVKNISTTIEDIWQGTFDYKLLKPIDSQFLASVGYVRPRSIVRLLIGVILIIYSLSALGIQPSWGQLWLFLVMFGCALVVSYVILICVVIVALYSPHIFNLTESFIGLISLSRYPVVFFRIFGDIWLYLLLPLVTLTSVPAQIILGKPDYQLIIISAMFSLVSFVGVRCFWKFSLRHYHSAGG